jgi:hypothetical protein
MRSVKLEGLNLRVAGRYRATLTDSVTGEVRYEGEWFDNLVTDIGLERMGTGAFLTRCHIGSGTSAPAVSDTGLQSPLGESSTVTSDTTGTAASAPHYGWRRKTFRFTAGVGTGTVSEVSIGWATGNASAFSRALLPSPITKLSTDILDITYELRSLAPAADASFNCVIASVAHACASRAAVVNSISAWTPDDQAVTPESALCYSGALGGVTAFPGGTEVAATSFSALPYVANSKQRRIQLDWNTDVANFAEGVRSIYVRTSIGTFQCEFTPPINKVGPPQRSLRLTVFVSWARL